MNSRIRTRTSVSNTARAPLISLRILPSQCLRCSSGLRVATIALERSMKPSRGPQYHETVMRAVGMKTRPQLFPFPEIEAERPGSPDIADLDLVQRLRPFQRLVQS